MPALDDPAVARLLERPNHAVISTINADGSIHSTVVWVNVEDGKAAVNSAVGRKWPTNLENNPTTALVVYDETNPYEYVEIRGTAVGRLDGADDHIDRLAKKFLNADSYPFRQAEEQRISYLIQPSLVRHQKQ